MLNIGRMAPASHDYYLSIVAAGVEDYYLARGEAPGRWLGRGTQLVGLEGRVEADPLRHVLAGAEPHTGTRLAAHPARKVPGFDLTFRAPKSVSLLWALADGAVASEVREAHDAAMEATISFVEREAARTRRGAGGSERVEVDGLIAAAFRHRSSRAGDPLLHTHVLVANLARTTDDGVWRTLESRRLFLYAKTAGYLYQAHLRYELTRRLGVAWEPVVNGYADLTGIPRPLIEAFSQRRHAIRQRLEERGESSAKAAQVATLETRAAKERQQSEVELRREWARRADRLGFDRAALDGLLHRRSHQPTDPQGLVAELVEREALVQHSSTFTHRDLLRAVAERLPDGAPVEVVEQLAGNVLDRGRDELVALGPRRGRLASVNTIRRGDGRIVVGDESEARLTTRKLLLLEHEAIKQAVGRRSDAAATVPAPLVESVIARHRTLSGEQADMVRRLTLDGDGVAVVVGRAGTGKTFALDAARQAWAQAGITVQGAALAARAARELQDAAGIPSTTIHRLLASIDQRGRGSPLPPGSVLVVDEAGMVGTRMLARLLLHAAQQRVKVVLVGDPAQLPEIDAGGLFAALTTRLDAIELIDNRRQHDPWEVAALEELRHGNPATALDAYRSRGRIVSGDSAEAIREQLVADWWQARNRSGATSAVMIALRHADVADLNARARHHLEAAGMLSGPALEVDGVEFRAGDRVVCLRNDRRLRVVNGMFATVDEVDITTQTLTITTDAETRITLPHRYLHAGHLAHGYAITGHKTQGLTVDCTFVLASAELYREWGYVALSRGRHENRLYVHATALDPDGALHGRPPDPDPHQLIGAALQRSRAQTPLTDHDLDAAQVAGRWRQLRQRLAAAQLDRRAELNQQQSALLGDRDHQAHLMTRLQQQRKEAARRLGRVTKRAELGRLDAELDRRRRARERLDGQLEQVEAELHVLPPLSQVQPLLDDYREASAEIAHAAELRASAAEYDPPRYVVRSLGWRPADAAERQRWRTAVRAVEEYRLCWNVTDPERALGDEPTNAIARAHRQHAIRSMVAASLQQNRTPQQGRGFDRSLGL